MPAEAVAGLRWDGRAFEQRIWIFAQIASASSLRGIGEAGAP
jgi:hypothetical protein